MDFEVRVDADSALGIHRILMAVVAADWNQAEKFRSVGSFRAESASQVLRLKAKRIPGLPVLGEYPYFRIPGAPLRLPPSTMAEAVGLR